TSNRNADKLIMKRRTLREYILEVRDANEEAISEKYLVAHLFEDARFFLERAKEYERVNISISRRYIRTALIAAFAGLEAFINTLCEIGAAQPEDDWDLPEQAEIEEK